MAIGFPAGTPSLTLTNLNNGFATTGTPSYVNVVGLDISPTGDRMFLASRDTDSIYRYDLSTPFDFTTASHVQTLSLGGSINPYGIKFSPTGNRLFVLNSNGPVLQWISTGTYSLSTGGAWQSYNYGTASVNNTRGIAFNTDGTKMTILTYGGATGIHEFDLTTGFDPSTATYNSVYFNTAPYMTVPMNHWFNSTGTKLYVSNYSGNTIHTFYLATPFDISSSNITVGPISNNAPGGGEQHQHVFNADETQLYVIKSSTSGSGLVISNSFVEEVGLQDGDEFTFNNRDYIYDGTKEAWEVNSPITVAQSGSPVSDLSELADSTSILDDPANEVLTYADLNAILAVTNPATGQLAFNLDTSDMYIFGGTNWQKVYDEDDVPPPFSFGGDRAIMNIGYSSVESYTGRLDYYDITTASNAQIFGDLTNANSNGKAGFSDSTYGVFAGGIISGGVRSTEIDYITISTTANAQSFGNLTVGRAGVSGCSDGTYGLAAGGDDGAGADSEVIDYVTIATPSNAIDFGDLQNATGRREMGSCSDATYGLWAGGYGSVYHDEVDYVTIQTPANAQSFGNLSSTRSLTAGVSDGTYGLFAGGFTVSGSVIFTNVIEYYTITSPGSATDFGDLSSNKRGHGAAGNATRATFAGGFNNDAGQQITTIEYVTVATPGNVTAFGDLTTNAYQAVGTSGNAA